METNIIPTNHLKKEQSESILEKIYRASLKLLEPLNPEETYALIVKEAIKLVNADYASLVVGGEDGFQQVYSTLPVQLSRRKKGHTYKAFKDNKAYVLHQNSFGKTHPVLAKLGLISNVYIPISYRNKSIGVLILNSKKEKYFTQKELHILQLFGAMASLGIRKTELYAETKRALELRDQFIPLAAHELRTPLTSINGYIQLLHSKLASATSIESKWIDELLFESKRLTRLVAELLEINRVNSNNLNLEFRECQIQEIINNAFNEFKVIYPDREVQIHDTSNSQNLVIADKHRITMILAHLLDNAAKFSPSNSKIEINALTSSKTVSICIEDHGEGMSKEDLNKIFEGFYKGKFTHKTGMGLGLFLTKALIEAHKGEVKIQSKLNKGTKVTIKLPKVKNDS